MRALAVAAAFLAGCATQHTPADPAARQVRLAFDALDRAGETDPARWDGLGGEAADVDAATSSRSYDRAESLQWPDPSPASDVELSLPFAGRWVVTQGNRGPFSHRRLADRFAWDFQSEDRGGAYGAVVLAPADGVVERAEDFVPDNRDGERNLASAAGNVVVLRHGPAEFSHFCHLASGSVVVREGQAVRRGDALGRCGRSGNAAEPHLHFVLRRGPTSRDVSIPARFEGASITRRGPSAPHADGVPGEGDLVEPTPR